MIVQIIGDLKRTISESIILAHKLNPEAFLLSDETKEKIRKKRLIFLKNHPEKTAWRQKNLSYPEKCFLKLLENEKLNKKYNIIRQFSVFPYFIDFVFTDIKLAVEIDGSQHLSLEYKNKDMKKDELLKSKNWKILRIEARAIMYEYENVKNELLNILKNYSIDLNEYKINSKIMTGAQIKLIEKNKKRNEKIIEKQKLIEERKK